MIRSFSSAPNRVHMFPVYTGQDDNLIPRYCRKRRFLDGFKRGMFRSITGFCHRSRNIYDHVFLLNYPFDSFISQTLL